MRGGRVLACLCKRGRRWSERRILYVCMSKTFINIMRGLTNEAIIMDLSDTLFTEFYEEPKLINGDLIWAKS